MANNERFNSVEKTPLTRDTGHDHNVTDQARHLNSKTGEKGASVSQPLVEFANPEYDTEAHFSNHPKNMRAHLPSKEETK